jgi:hypothetical protein
MISLVVGGVFNAFAFAGAGFLFSHLDKKGDKEEAERHNRALEQLTKDRDAFNKRETLRRDKWQRKRAELEAANRDIASINRAFREYARVTRTVEGRQPKLEDYYQPSNEMRKYALMTAGLIGVGGAYVVTRLI